MYLKTFLLRGLTSLYICIYIYLLYTGFTDL